MAINSSSYHQLIMCQYNYRACLLDCGLVQNRREGKNIFYSIRNKMVSNILREGDTILSEIARGIFECVNYNEEPKKK